MTFDEMQDVARRVERIASLRNRLTEIEKKLALINRLGPGKEWEVPIRLKDGGHYDRPTEIFITVPFGVVQQQAVNRVAAVQREIIQLGGIP